jgi:HlyD family type I secretion membrane fusion protein
MSIVRYRQPKRSDSTALATVTFESATAEIVARYHPFTERAALYLLAAMLAGIAVFVSVAKLDRVVKAQGRIVPTGGALTVQPMEQAIISRVLVQVGDVVKKGQVLATCDPTFVHADLSALEEKVASLQAQKRRMETEEAALPFHPDPSKPSDVLQASLMNQRSVEFKAGITDFDQRIHAAEAQIAGYQDSISDLDGRLKIARETEDMYTKMEAAGIATRLDLIGVQDKTLDTLNQLTEQKTLLDSTQHTLESLREQRKVFVDKWHDDTLTKLVDVQDQYDQAVNDLTKAKKLNDMVNLVAPVDAVVLKIPVLSTGGVATDAEPLFSLMPLNTPIEVNAQIDAEESGFVQTGDPVTIKFATYNFLEYGTADGIVKTISQDSFTELDEQDSVTKSSGAQIRSPYFDARIKITALHLHDLPHNAHLVPGMPLEASIVVGRRTILWYLFSGALRSGSDAMHEP